MTTSEALIHRDPVELRRARRPGYRWASLLAALRAAGLDARIEVRSDDFSAVQIWARIDAERELELTTAWDYVPRSPAGLNDCDYWVTYLHSPSGYLAEAMLPVELDDETLAARLVAIVEEVDAGGHPFLEWR